MSGKATATEIEDHWTYSDILRCILYMDMEAVSDWEANKPIEDTKKPQNSIIC